MRIPHFEWARKIRLAEPQNTEREEPRQIDSYEQNGSHSGEGLKAAAEDQADGRCAVQRSNALLGVPPELTDVIEPGISPSRAVAKRIRR